MREIVLPNSRARAAQRRPHIKMAKTNALLISENTSKNTHNVVDELLAAKADCLTVLDIPCGEGAFTKRMLDRGVDVFAADCQNILRFSHRNFTITDMNERLPYEDGMFDAAVCIDGIEHIKRPFDFIKECHRIIRKGGQLIISTPNLTALRSRWRWLLTGFHQGEKIPLDESTYSPLHHVSLVSFPDLRYRLHASGFKIAAVRTNRIKFISWLYSPLVLPAYLMTAWVFHKEGRHSPRSEQNREILRQCFSIPVLYGETLIVKAIRE